MATINKLNKKISFAIVAVFLLLGFFLITKPQQKIPGPLAPSQIKTVQIGGTNVKVDLALTPAEQEEGLSGRSALAPDHGMLFVFDKPAHYPFWMKDMYFPIDMIWLDANKQVIYIEQNATPASYPETFGPDADAMYVLEVVSGFTQKYNVKVGETISFN